MDNLMYLKSGTDIRGTAIEKDGKSIDLTDARLMSITASFVAFLKKKLGKDIDFEYKIDNSIIGGFIINLDGKVYDNSIKTQLERLKKHIKNGDEA
jgi:F0F1-type ATP synthase delta subunit